MTVRGATDLETHVVSIERIKEYSETETEVSTGVSINSPCCFPICKSALSNLRDLSDTVK